MLFKIKLVDVITIAQLDHELSRCSRIMDRSPSAEMHSLLIDASTATNYERDARRWFTDTWGPANRSRVFKIAIVTKNVILRMAATTVGLVARYRIDAFATVKDAEDWLAKV